MAVVSGSPPARRDIQPLLGVSTPTGSDASQCSVLSPSLWIPQLVESSIYVNPGPEFFARCLAEPELTVHFRAAQESFAFLGKDSQTSGESIHLTTDTNNSLNRVDRIGGSGDQDTKEVHDAQRHFFITRGYVCRKQGLGRRLCFIDIVNHADVWVNGFSERPKSVSNDSECQTEAISPGPDLTQRHPKDPYFAHGVCLSFFSPLLGDIDVHRSILRRLSTGDFVEAVGLMEKRKEDSHIQHVRNRVVQLTGNDPAAIESALRGASTELFRSVQCLFSFKVLSVRASKQPTAVSLLPLAQRPAVKCSNLFEIGGTNYRDRRIHSSSQERECESVSITKTASFKDAADSCVKVDESCVDQSVGKTTNTHSRTEVPEDMNYVCKYFLISGRCCRKDCPLFHIRSPTLRHHYDLLKARRQVQRVQQQLGAQTRQHPQLGPGDRGETLGSNGFSADLVNAIRGHNGTPVHDSPFFRRTEQYPNNQSFLVHPKSRRAEVFADWLVSTYGIERLRSGEGVVDVAGGRGELAFELTMKYGIPCCIIDPRCTYTSKSLAVQPPEAQHRWFKTHSETEKPLASRESSTLLDFTGGVSLDLFDVPTTAVDSSTRSHVRFCNKGGPEHSKAVSAMVSGSKRAFECPLKLTRRQAKWLRRHHGLRGVEAESFFRSRVETIPAIFSVELVTSCSYVRNKLFHASAIVGLHPDEATGSIFEVGLMIETMRKQQSECTPFVRTAKCKYAIKEFSRPISNLPIADVRQSGAEQCPQSTSGRNFTLDSQLCDNSKLALAVVPCCVFSDIFPHRRIPFHALLKSGGGSGMSDATNTEKAMHRDTSPITPEYRKDMVSATDDEREVDTSRNIPVGVERDGTLLVRTYEELLVWLLLLDPQKRLQQETLPVVGKNRVIFLPP